MKSFTITSLILLVVLLLSIYELIILHGEINQLHKELKNIETFEEKIKLKEKDVEKEVEAIEKFHLMILRNEFPDSAGILIIEENWSSSK